VQQIWLDCSYLESFPLHSQGISHLWAMTIPVAPFLAEGLWIRFVCIMLVCWLVKSFGVEQGFWLAWLSLGQMQLVKKFRALEWWSTELSLYDGLSFSKGQYFMKGVMWLHRTKLKMKKKHSPW
jgi:hypothetical protein